MFKNASAIRRTSGRLVLVLLLSSTVGCGGGGASASVSGTVTFQGAPVTEGRLQFQSEAGDLTAVATLDEQGGFAIPELYPGIYTVIVRPPEEEAPTSPTPVAAKEYANIPQKYRVVDSSDLKATIGAGDNTIAFDMQP